MKVRSFFFYSIIPLCFLLISFLVYFFCLKPDTAVTGNGMGGGNAVFSEDFPAAETQNKYAFSLFYYVYVVKQGDMVGSIAGKYGVSQDAIISLNKLKNTRTLQIGQILKIPSIDGIPYRVQAGDTPETIADAYKISLEKLAKVNMFTDNTVEPASMIFLPDAKLDWATLQEINGDLFKKPLRRGYAISSRYGWRDNPFMAGTRSFHNGIDMAAPQGTPVYAALSGKVIATGESNIYGNYIIIRHHSGYQTLYGHLHTILTTPGASVSPVSKIGTVGSTGMSTGPHLHFTVFKNGATLNPAALWH